MYLRAFLCVIFTFINWNVKAYIQWICVFEMKAFDLKDEICQPVCIVLCFLYYYKTVLIFSKTCVLFEL